MIDNLTESEVQFVRRAGLPQVELRFSFYRSSAFERHAHDSFAIGLVTQGRTRCCRYNPLAQAEVLGRGDMALINPGEVHDCNPLDGEGLAYNMLYLDPAFLQKLAGEAGCGQGEAFAFSEGVVRAAPLGASFERLCRALLNSHSSLLEIESRLYETLTALARRYGGGRAGQRPTGKNSPGLERAYDTLRANLERNVSLQELAEKSGQSPYAFLRAFRARYGLPPHTCQLQLRINLARHLLAAGQPIAAVAAEAGFADQSHLTRKFKALVGATPRQYRAGRLT